MKPITLDDILPPNTGCSEANALHDLVREGLESAFDAIDLDKPFENNTEEGREIIQHAMLILTESRDWSQSALNKLAQLG